MSRADLWGLAKPIVEPKPWPVDGCRRREAVIDHNDSPPRVVRYVGWRKCMTCNKPFFSQDVRGLRMCDYCRKNTSDSHDW